jgi:hypothetical protein
MGPLKAALLWIAINLVTMLIVRLSGRPYVRLSYDSFCREPGRTIELLNRTLDLDIPVEGLLDRINAGGYHNVGGNLLRFKRIDSIRHDEKWRTKLPRFQRTVVSILTAPFNALWVRGAPRSYRRGRS